MRLVERVERTDFGKAIELVFAEFGDAQSQVVEAAEWARGACAQKGLAGLLAQAAGIAEAEAEVEGWQAEAPAPRFVRTFSSGSGGTRADQGVCPTGTGAGTLDGAEPFGFRYVYRQDPQAVALRVFDENGGRIKAHGLVVEHGAGEGCQVMALQIRAGVGQQRKAGGVRYREAI